jgi:hypothetical protein
MVILDDQCQMLLSTIVAGVLTSISSLLSMWFQHDQDSKEGETAALILILNEVNKKFQNAGIDRIKGNCFLNCLHFRE